MLVILFLAALLFAIPTYGLSLLAYFGFLIIRGYFMAKGRIHYANEIEAQRVVNEGKGRFPSWMGDKGETLIFIEAVQGVLAHKGVPLVFTQAVMATDEFKQMLRHAGEMEALGASFISQQVSVQDKIYELWLRAPQRLRNSSMDDDDDIPF